MKREFLTSLDLTDEQKDSIMNEHGKTVNKVKEEQGSLKETVDNLKKEIATRDGQINSLSKSAELSEQLKADLEKVKGENAGWQDKYSKSQLQANVKLAAAKDANDVNDILFFIDTENLKLNEDGSVEGLEAQLTSLKESKPYLFNANAAQVTDDTQVPPVTDQKKTFVPGQTAKIPAKVVVDPAARGIELANRLYGKKEE